MPKSKRREKAVKDGQKFWFLCYFEWVDIANRKRWVGPRFENVYETEEAAMKGFNEYSDSIHHAVNPWIIYRDYCLCEGYVEGDRLIAAGK